MEKPGPITFTYSYTDYLALNRLMRRDSLWKRTQFIRVPLAAAIAVSCIVVAQAAFRDQSIAGAFSQVWVSWEFWAIVAASPVLVWIINRIELRLYYRRQRIDGAMISISFDDKNGITSEGPTGTGIVPWSAVRKIVSDANAHVVLYENRAIGLCLPRHAFESQKGFDDMAAYFSARINTKPAA
jgi:YcxB-like protein